MSKTEVQRIIKRCTELTPDEVAQMKVLTLVPEHVSFQPSSGTKEVPIYYYLYKKNTRLLAFSSVSLHRDQTPFAAQPIPIYTVYQAYKDPESGREIKNFAQATNFHFLQMHLGRLWFLRPAVMVYGTMNPKLIARSSHYFKELYPIAFSPSTAVLKFARRLGDTYLNLPPEAIDDQLVVHKEDYYAPDVTAHWEEHYKASDARYNDFFVKQGILKKHPDGKMIMASNKTVLTIGYHTPQAAIKYLWKRWRK